MKLKKPSELKGFPMGSFLQKHVLEQVANNFKIICIESGDKWCSFTWEEYKSLCRRKVSRREKTALDELVNRGCLEMEGDKYSATVKFLALWN